jgi:hypothetical protein
VSRLKTGLLFVVGASALSVAQTTTAPNSRTPATWETQKPSQRHVDGHLVRTETITARSETAYSFHVPLRCDTDGNLYLRTELAGVPAIHKLNMKGEQVALFEASSNPDLKIDVAAYFAVDPSRGDLYELVYPHEMSRYVFTYRSDGRFKSAVKLATGFPFLPKKLAVFPGGAFLISGEEYDQDSSSIMWPFTGIFSADGTLLKELDLGDEKQLRDMVVAGDSRMARPGYPQSNRAVDNGIVETADNGNVYLMRWTNPAIFYAISAGGEVAHRFTVDPGESGYRPSAMHIYKNRIAILFVEMQRHDILMKIVDLEGHELATYDESKVGGRPGNLSAAFACYTENPTRFVFLGADENDKVQFWIAEPR